MKLANYEIQQEFGNSGTLDKSWIAKNITTNVHTN